MTRRTLVALSIGPVQTFISAARRTRDLWAGSALLSALAAAAARAFLASPDAKIIFPASAAAQAQAAQASGVANKLVACWRVDDPASALQKVEEAIRVQLQTEAKLCLDQLRERHAVQAIDEVRFTAQLADALEVHWAWVDWSPEGDYSEAFARVQALLDARKQTRDFLPLNDEVLKDKGIRKNPTGVRRHLNGDKSHRPSAPMLSSLDGRYESILVPGPACDRLRRVFQINQNEELDALALIKRVNGGVLGFPSVTRIALQPWIGSLLPVDLTKLSDQMKQFVGEPFQLARRYKVDRLAADNPLRHFNFDGEVLLPSRRHEFSTRQAPTAKPALDDLGKLLHTLRGAPGDGVYVCVLMADGDRMGELLQDQNIVLEDHQRISDALAGFAANAYVLMPRHGGACVYAGGDDVLALCPVDTALAAARELSDSFNAALRPVMPRVVPPGCLPSLSVGLGFGHVLHPLGDLRRIAQEALHLAKQGEDGLGLRNALGIVLAPRGGGEVLLAGTWDGAYGTNTGFDRCIALWRDAFASGQLAHGAPYDLNQLARRSGSAALSAEAARLFGRRLSDPAARAALAQALQVREAGDATTDEQHYGRLAAQWYIGRWLAAHAVAPRPVSHQEMEPT